MSRKEVFGITLQMDLPYITDRSEKEISQSGAPDDYKSLPETPGDATSLNIQNPIKTQPFR